MSTNRSHHRSAVGLLVTASLLLMLKVWVGLTAAATGTSGASSSRALQGAVRMHLWGPGLGPGNFSRGGLRRFTMSGSISDRGAFLDHRYRRGEMGRGVRVLFGYKGTIQITVGHYGSWRITNGTNAYAGLRGRGTRGSLWRGDQGGVDIRMDGTVSQ